MLFEDCARHRPRVLSGLPKRFTSFIELAFYLVGRPPHLFRGANLAILGDVGTR
ncbi:hypothetical protein [Streptomyces sp. NPDC058330]|uniref:hypothetical protein n=1 Tax=Streptomyces sp. NPDC058330 TaxID=3346449 RepID=UPI0036EB5694